MDWSAVYQRLKREPNDEAAWRAVETIVRAWAHAALHQHGRDVVEDAVADTCSTVAISLDRARGAATFSGFVLGIFFNTRRRALQIARAPLDVLDGIDVAAPAPDSGPDPDDLAALEAGLAALPSRERRALQLKFFEERSAAAVAAELGVTEVNARRIVCNGLGRLRRHMVMAREGRRRVGEPALVR